MKKIIYVLAVLLLGGNANAAGGTVKDAKVADVRLQLLAAIDEYFKP